MGLRPSLLLALVPALGGCQVLFGVDSAGDEASTGATSSSDAASGASTTGTGAAAASSSSSSGGIGAGGGGTGGAGGIDDGGCGQAWGGRNLLPDPGMEAAPTTWNGFRATVAQISDPVHGGVHAISICSTGDVEGPQFGAWADIPTTEAIYGKTYDAHMCVHGDPTGSAPAFVQLGIREQGSDVMTKTSWYGDELTPNPAWQHAASKHSIDNAANTKLVLVAWVEAGKMQPGECFVIDDGYIAEP